MQIFSWEMLLPIFYVNKDSDLEHLIWPRKNFQRFTLCILDPNLAHRVAYKIHEMFQYFRELCSGKCDLVAGITNSWNIPIPILQLRRKELIFIIRASLL